jgi:glycosyltransferase involved in cell wall biosynthesis
MPKVSVNMPCYNCEKHVGMAIDSILKQTFRDFELIVVNDGSTDNSLEVIKSFDDPRIIIVDNEVNQGIVATRNTAIARSSGEYIAILDSDDIASAERLAEQVAFLDAHPDYGIIGSWIEIIDENGIPTGEIGKTPENPEMMPVLSLFQNCFAQSSVLLRKTSLPEKLYNPELSMSEDYDLWIRVLENSKGGNLQKPLVKYRVHPSNNSKRVDEIKGCLKAVIIKQLRKLGIVPDESELVIHTNFYGIGGFDVLRLSDIETWLLKLVRCNAESGAFNRRLLEDVTWNVWLVVLYRQPFVDVVMHGLSSYPGIYQLPRYSRGAKSMLILRILFARLKSWLLTSAAKFKQNSWKMMLAAQ